MKAIEEIKSQLKDAGFNNDSLLVTSIEKAFNELQKENEELKASKRKMAIDNKYIEINNLKENEKLKAENIVIIMTNKELKERVKELEENAQNYGEFCVRVDREKKQLIFFKDFEKLIS